MSDDKEKIKKEEKKLDALSVEEVNLDYKVKTMDKDFFVSCYPLEQTEFLYHKKKGIASNTTPHTKNKINE